MTDPSISQELPAGSQVGRYTIVRRLGRGGMGVVYVARDDRLERDVALKMIAGLQDATAISRFWREARAAASINHPNVCQLYEVDESADGIFLAMELLDGEPLDTRVDRGPLSPADAVRISVEVLGALGALHARGFVHRDVKPSNVFITAHGAKLLDFGLARPALADTLRLDSTPRDDVTGAGVILGTPRYMAPEQVTGDAVDGRTDIYAVGAVLFEMLAGRPPFRGENAIDLIYAALHEQPPALQGPTAVVALDRVIRRAMAKPPDARYATADAMAAELRAVTMHDDATAGVAVPVRALTRIVVPPVRLTRPDAEIDFLSFGLAEAMSGSLASLAGTVVRAPAIAAAWAVSDTDPRKLAAHADVDLVISGSLLRSGTQLRATVQLVDATNGSVLGAETVKGSLADVFVLEEEMSKAAISLITRRAGASAPAPAGNERRDVPANARAFELFLRGNDAMRDSTNVELARGLFENAVREDPGFAPAWAMLGRCQRFVGKFIADREVNMRLAEESLHRAIALSPNLPSAHRYLTHIESERGRADAAIGRLLEQARRSRNDPQIFAGLVHALRYAGLVRESLAAHDEARRLDPTVATSVEYTLVLLNDPALDDRLRGPNGTTPVVHATALIWALREPGPMGRDRFDSILAQPLTPGFRVSIEALRAAAAGTREEALEAIATAIRAHDDPEALFLLALGYARINEIALGIPLLRDVVRSGYSPVDMLASDPLIDQLRASPEFDSILASARARRATATLIFERGGGRTLLGVGAPS